MRFSVVPRAHLVVALDHQVVKHRYIAGGIGVGSRGAQLGVGDDALVQLDAGVADRLGVVVETDAVGEDVELDLLAVHGLGQEMAVQPAEALHLIRGYELDALRFAELPAQPAAFLVEDITQEPWPAHHPSDFRGLSKAHAFRSVEVTSCNPLTVHDPAFRSVGR